MNYRESTDEAKVPFLLLEESLQFRGCINPYLPFNNRNFGLQLSLTY